MDSQTNNQIDPETQKVLNTPLATPAGNDPKDEEFLNTVLDLISKGTIDLYKPETLINHAVYDQLPVDKKGKADIEAFNVLSKIRDIKGLNDAGFTGTFQMQNLVHSVRDIKERLEIGGGDVFII
ncbi:hypothetical protein COY05_01035 [Candidatus Peregrinibacteria bacterium CG_4_10_14_0_2_um_filter_38_24]|nr:MAG: hypothetical protein COY05_01035 [Candidatus Peregrinibacteria bacterium CG_4_10_14_0_2_um_filter_38_24]PJC39014.1 MAG: hypothetical protein CO044_01940 [Candidatus Peregrinibacteria bacterium CG_4_9_14_0_2_um_filter_38_9]